MMYLQVIFFQFGNELRDELTRLISFQNRRKQMIHVPMKP